MSLIEHVKPQHIALAAAVVIAIALPRHLVSGGSVTAEPQGRASATPISLREVPALIVARTAPLFAPGRVPSEMAAQLESEATAAASAAAAPPTPPPMLVGIVLRGNGAGVALAKGSDGQTQTLRAGEQIDGWTLVALSRAAVVFAQGGTRQTVTLDFGSAKVQSAQVSSSPSTPVVASASSAGSQPIPLPPPPDDAPTMTPRSGTPTMKTPNPMDPKQDKR